MPFRRSVLARLNEQRVHTAGGQGGVQLGARGAGADDADGAWRRRLPPHRSGGQEEEEEREEEEREEEEGCQR